jgi:hypothetical protein
MSLANLRARETGAVVASNVVVLKGETFIEDLVIGRNGMTEDKSFFAINDSQIVTVNAINTGEAKGAITVDREPKKLDAKGKPVLDADKKPVVLDEYHVTIEPGFQMYVTKSGYIGFGAIAEQVSASDRIAAKRVA